MKNKLLILLSALCLACLVVAGCEVSIVTNREPSASNSSVSASQSNSVVTDSRNSAVDSNTSDSASQSNSVVTDSRNSAVDSNSVSLSINQSETSLNSNIDLHSVSASTSSISSSIPVGELPLTETDEQGLVFNLSVDKTNYYVADYKGTSTQVVIPDTFSALPVKSINKAFYNCIFLQSVTIPSSVQTIGNHAFYGCANMQNITIPNSVQTIGNHAFYGCANMQNITIPNSVQTIGNYAFSRCASLQSITIPSSVQTIGINAFYGCDSLQSVTIPNSVQTIGSSAFRVCNSLQSVTIGNSVQSIGEDTFKSCKNLQSVVIGDSVQSIGSGAFYDCVSLQSITIPYSVQSLGGLAFENCYKLLEVYNLSSLEIIKGSSDNGYVGYYALDIYTSLDMPSKLSTDENGFVVHTNGSEKTIVDYVGSASEIEIANDITAINQNAFRGCKILQSVTIGNSVQSIGEYAFYGCDKLLEVYNLSSLEIIKGSSDNGYVGYYALDIYASLDTPSKLSTDENGLVVHTNGSEKTLVNYVGSASEIEIANNITAIDKYAFNNCQILKSVVIGDSVQSISDKAFYACDSLQSVVIGIGVQSIGDSAFNDCASLQSIVIGPSVQSIGSSAFGGCENLQKVYYFGSETDWENVLIDVVNGYLTESTRYYYSDTQPTIAGNYWRYIDGYVTEW